MGKIRNKVLWKEWIKMIQNIGFDVCYSNHFVGKSQEKEYREKECILYNKDKGLLVYACICKGELYMAKLFGQLVIKPNIQAEQKWDALHLCDYDDVILQKINNASSEVKNIIFEN